MKEEIIEEIVPAVCVADGVDWAKFRREMARDAVVSMLNSCSCDDNFPDPEEVCGMAVLYADELIKQLKDESKRV